MVHHLFLNWAIYLLSLHFKTPEIPDLRLGDSPPLHPQASILMGLTPPLIGAFWVRHGGTLP